jgi:hypothetical protein
MEGRRKEVLLLVLAVLALGVALYTFRSKPQPKPGAPAAQTPEGTAPAKPAAAAATPGAAGEQPGTLTPAGAAAAAAQRNPFAPPTAEVAQLMPQPGTPRAAASAAAGSAAAATTAGGEPGPAPSGAEGPAPAVQPPGLPPGTEPEPSFTLTGIVNGKPNVAILRQDGQRYFVKVGDAVGDSYRVKAIGNQQVVLVGQQGKVTLRMGGRQ